LPFVLKKKIKTSSRVDVRPIRKKIEERPEYRVKDGVLQSVVFRARDKNRTQTRFVGKKNKEFKFYEKAYKMGVYNSMERRKRNARRKKN